MSQPEPAKQSRPRRQWLLVVIALLSLGAVLLIVVVPLLFLTFSQSNQAAILQQKMALQEQARKNQHEAAARLSIEPVSQPAPAVESVQPHLARIEVQFEDLETRTANALVVDQKADLTLLVTAEEVFAEVTGKVNGRLVTRRPSHIKVVEFYAPPSMGMPGAMMPMSASPMMGGYGGGPGMGMGGPGSPSNAVEIATPVPDVGLMLLKTDLALRPLRFRGDFPQATAGEKLTVIARPQAHDSPPNGLTPSSSELTVLNLEETVRIADGQTVPHLLKLTPFHGELGAIVCNRQGMPVGQIIWTGDGPDRASFSYALPMDRLFQAVYRLTTPPQGSGAMKEGGESNPASEPVGSIKRLAPSPDSVAGQDPEFASPLDLQQETPIQRSAPPLPMTTVFHVRGVPGDVAKAMRERYSDYADLKVIEEKEIHSVIVHGPKQVLKLIQSEINIVDPAPATADFDPESMTGMAMGSGVIEEKRKPAEMEAGLEQEARRLAARYRSAPPGDKAALKKELEQLTERQFEARQSARKKEMDELGSRLENLRTVLQKRQQNKKEVIKRRVRDLLDPHQDLEWDASATGKTQNKPPLAAGAESELKSDIAGGFENALGGAKAAKADAGPEQTFDGLRYAEWASLLETETKPEKLVIAIEAVGRLVKDETQSQIAHKLIGAAEYYETNDWNSTSLIWPAVGNTLNRLQPQVVVNEILAALRASDPAQEGGVFLSEYVATRSTDSVRRAYRPVAKELVKEFLDRARSNAKNGTWPVTAACIVWHSTGLSISEFDGLESLALERISAGPTSEWAGQGEGWQILAETIVELDPAAPNLALKLIGPAEKNLLALKLIEKLGPRAAPVEASLVGQFVTAWNQSQVSFKDSYGPGALGQDPGERLFRVQQLRTLHKIGIGSHSARLFHELRLIAPPASGRSASPDRNVFGIFQRFDPDELALISKVEASKFLLNDRTMIDGAWKAISAKPGTIQPNADVRIQYPRTLASGGATLEVQFPAETGKAPLVLVNRQQFIELDPESTPKKIIFHGQNVAQPLEGVYELTERTLRIQLAIAGQPSPTEIVKDSSQLPEGEVLLEFVRQISAEP